ncbi:MAG TPA: hypothetical protein VGG28_15405 [Kofleriaceae bacterium]|jgi:hypothetical protein
MNLEATRPAHCHARATRLLGEVALVRDELGRSEDARPVAELTDGKPRDCYFEAIASWHKAARLGAEVGAPAVRFAHATPPIKDIQPGHVLEVIDAVIAQLAAIKAAVGIRESASEPQVGDASPGDVLSALIRVNRQLSRSLERPFAPSDCYRVVALASAYAARMGSPRAELEPFERKREPRHCFEHLLACHHAASAAIAKRGQPITAARGVPNEVLPGDVYDLASVVLAEVAFLWSLTPNAAPVHAFEPEPTGFRLPAHVDQLARTLHAQLGKLA